MSQFKPNPSSAVAVAEAIRTKDSQVSECQCCPFLDRAKSSTKDWADYTILKLAQAKYSTDKPITLLDVGSGHGASVLHTAALLAEHGYEVHIQLCEPSLFKSKDAGFPGSIDPNPIDAEFISQYEETITQLNTNLAASVNDNQVGKVVLSGRYATLQGMKYALLQKSGATITLDEFVAANVEASPWSSQNPEQEKKWLKESIEADIGNNPNPSKCDVATFVDLDDAYKPLTDWMKENYETLVNPDGWMFGLTKSTLPRDHSPSIFRQMYQFSNPKHLALKESVTHIMMDQSSNVSSQVLAQDEQILPVLFAGVKPLEVMDTRSKMQGLSVAKFKLTFGMYFRHHGVENVKYFLLGLTVIFPLVVTGLYLYRLFAPSSDAPQRNPAVQPPRAATGVDSVSAVSMSSWTLYYEHCAHALSGNKPKYLLDEKEQRATEQQRQRLGI